MPRSYVLLLLSLLCVSVSVSFVCVLTLSFVLLISHVPSLSFVLQIEKPDTYMLELYRTALVDPSEDVRIACLIGMQFVYAKYTNVIQQFAYTPQLASLLAAASGELRHRLLLLLAVRILNCFNLPFFPCLALSHLLSSDLYLPLSSLLVHIHHLLMDSFPQTLTNYPPNVALLSADDVAAALVPMLAAVHNPDGTLRVLRFLLFLPFGGETLAPLFLSRLRCVDCKMLRSGSRSCLYILYHF